MENPEEVYPDIQPVDVTAGSSPVPQITVCAPETNNNQQPEETGFNKTKVETTSSASEDEDGMNDDNENSQDSQAHPNDQKPDCQNTDQGKNDDDPSLPFRCLCGKNYSRNASLFNHIRIKHENKIQQWKVFEGMRKQGRPKKEAAIQPMQSSQISKQGASGLDGYEKMRNFNQEAGNLSHPQKGTTDHHLPLHSKGEFVPLPISGSSHLPPHSQFNRSHPNNYSSSRHTHAYPFYPPQDIYHLELNNPMASLISNFKDEKINVSLSMEIMIRFKDILIDSNDARLSEAEEKQFLFKAYSFQLTLFKTHSLEYEPYRQPFDNLYLFIQYWIKYMKREKIEETCREYLKFHFSKITGIQIEATPIMEKLQSIYDSVQSRFSRLIAESFKLPQGNNNNNNNNSSHPFDLQLLPDQTLAYSQSQHPPFSQYHHLPQQLGLPYPRQSIQNGHPLPPYYQSLQNNPSHPNHNNSLSQQAQSSIPFVQPVHPQQYHHFGQPHCEGQTREIQPQSSIFPLKSIQYPPPPQNPHINGYQQLPNEMIQRRQLQEYQSFPPQFISQVNPQDPAQRQSLSNPVSPVVEGKIDAIEKRPLEPREDAQKGESTSGAAK